MMNDVKHRMINTTNHDDRHHVIVHFPIIERSFLVLIRVLAFENKSFKLSFKLKISKFQNFYMWVP